MLDWKIGESISNGIEKGFQNIANSITEKIAELFSKAGIALLDGAGTFILMMAFYYIFKYMLCIKKDKQEDNINVVVSLGGLYFIVKMFVVMMKGYLQQQ